MAQLENKGYVDRLKNWQSKQIFSKKVWENIF